MKSTRVRTTLLATAVAIAALSRVAQATPVVYTIDPTQSSSTLTGFIISAAFPFTSQVDTSNTDAIGGTIVGDLSGGVLTITAGSVLDYQLNPNAALFQPNTLGVEGNIAVTAATAPVIGVAFLGAIRDLVSTIAAGGTLTNGAPANIGLQITAGSLNTNLGNGNLASATISPNVSVGNVSLSNNGVTETLTIPFQTVVLGTNPASNSTTTGTLVATRQIPEPSTLVLAGLGVMGMALVAWRKR